MNDAMNHCMRKETSKSMLVSFSKETERHTDREGENEGDRKRSRK